MQSIHNQFTIPFNFQKTFQKYPERPFLAFSDEQPLSYSEVNEKILSIRKLLISNHIGKGDTVAILSGNMPHWAIVYLAVTTSGAVAVPILPDFSNEEVCNIIKHSDAKALFVSELQLPKIENFCSSELNLLVRINDLEVLKSVNQDSTIENEAAISDQDIADNDLAVIIYTSGTTGNPKGVMLTHKNIIFNVLSARHLQPVSEHDRFLSLLPLSHTYENTLGLLLPMVSGASVYYLKKLPTPSVLINAMKEISPTMMLSVPLIIEKIYRNKILPQIQSAFLTRNLYKLPPVRKLINKAAGKKLMETFGGKIHFFGIGGSKLDPNVEKFLLEAKFPFAIGYGLTETSPLLAGTNPNMVRWQSTGPAVQGVELKLMNTDSKSSEGEIIAKGPNVMSGYYKNPEATQEVFTEDGWFRTGDLGTIDNDGFVFIRGRKKNVIIGSNGENIYPEEIESLINNFDFVAESLVIEQKGKLVAYVHFNIEELNMRYQHLKTEISDYIDIKVLELSEEIKIYVNSKVSTYANLKMVLVHNEPFEKTPTQKIKRFKYIS